MMPPSWRMLTTLVTAAGTGLAWRSASSALETTSLAVAKAAATGSNKNEAAVDMSLRICSSSSLMRFGRVTGSSKMALILAATLACACS